MGAKNGDWERGGSYPRGEVSTDEVQRLELQASLLFEEEVALLRSMGYEPGGIFLDAGCGPAKLLRRLAEQDEATHFIGVDKNQSLLEVARRECSQRSNVTIHEHDLHELRALECPQADFIYSRLVFSHLGTPLRVLAEFNSTLKPGGRVALLDVDDSLIVISPPHQELSRLLETASRVQSSHGGDRNIGGQLTSLLSHSGFVQVTSGTKTWTIASESSLPLLQLLLDGRRDYLDELDRACLDETTTELRRQIEDSKISITFSVRYASGKRAD